MSAIRRATRSIVLLVSSAAAVVMAAALSVPPVALAAAHSPSGSSPAPVAATAPRIRAVSPGEGAPGWPVRISGRRFVHVKSVTFGGVKAKFRVVSKSLIKTRIPARARSGALVVRTLGGRARAGFTVTPRDALEPNEVMPDGDSLLSSDRHFRLVMQADGNLVEYVNGGHALWGSGTNGHPGAHVVMQGDGNLVVYKGSTPLWASGTGGKGAAVLVVQTDANLVLYQGSHPIWGSNSYDNALQPGESLRPGQYLESADRHFSLFMQADGNLVEYVTGTGHPLWGSGTNGHPGAHVVMQGDGNLVIYKGSTPLWSSGTAGKGPATFYDQVDANLVVYHGSTPTWASGSYDNSLRPGEFLDVGWYLESGNGYQLVMQGDGNLVEYGSGGAMWASNTAGHPGADVVMQGDGNLVVYQGGKALWASNTAGHPGAQLVDQQDGNQVIYAGGAALWASNSVVSPLTFGSWPGTGGPGAANKYYGYPYPDPPACTDGGACLTDKWYFYEGQCTSWVAYRLNQLNGIAFSNYFGGSGRWGDASNWGPHARALGIAVNGTPAVGSVAWYSSGHVAYVEKVNSPSSIVISEMNYDYDNGFRVWTITTSSGYWPTAFIHIHDR